MSKFIKLSAVLAVLLGTLAGSAQAEITDSRYTNQTPYGNPLSTPIAAAPDGYSMFFIETIGRHGSRSLTSKSAEDRARSVWNAARKKGALTYAGKKFEADLNTFQRAERKIGYGMLSNLGIAEWKGIGRRTAENYEGFFTTLAPADTIARVTSTVTRTKQSATALRWGIDPVVPGLAYATPTVDEARLELSNGSTIAGRAAIEKVKKKSAVRTAAKNVLRRMYTERYVGSLTDPVAKAMDLYLLYCGGAAMSGNTRVTFARYFSWTDARTLGYMKDAENFYRYGPGVSGQTNSYRQAKPLLADFFTRLDQRVAGGNVAAVFRLGHGETTMPFAALIKAPRSQVQVPASSVYTQYNPWRGSVAGRPGGSVEWVAYKKPGDVVLVTMRYNEQPVAFQASCVPEEPFFYTVTELKRCLG